MRKSIAAATFAGVMMLYGQSSNATLYYLKSTGSTNWNIASIWYSTSTGTGGNAPPGSTVSPLDDFNLNGLTVGTPSGPAAAVFGGNSIDLAGGTLNLRNGGTKSVNIMTGTGNSLLVINQPPTTLGVNTFNASVSSTTTFQENTGTISTANVDTINFGTLTGSGNLAIDATGAVNTGGSRTFLLSVTTGRGFTGNLTWSTLHTRLPNWQFGNNLVLNGGLVANDSNSRITLDHDVTFARAVFNGTTLTPGTHTYASLKSSFNTIFNAGGSGSIIIPASSTWTNAASGSWETPANWQGGYFPRLPGNVATFSDPAVNVPFTTTLNNDEAVGSLVFNGNGGPTAIAASSTFSLFMDNTALGATIDASAAGADVTVSAPMVFNDNVTVALNNHNLTLLGAISNGTGGSHGLTVNATGTVYLSGANSYTGNTSVNTGVLNLSNSLALGGSTLTTGGIVFDSSVATHAFTFGGLSGSANIALQDNAGSPNAVALSVGNNNQSTTYSGILSGPGSLTKIGTGSLTIPTAQTYAGNTTITAGTLIAANGSTGSATSSGNITMGGGTLASAAGAGPTDTGTVTGAVSGSGTIAPGGVGTIGGLTIGNLTTGSALTLNFDLSGATAGDLLTVGGLTLGSSASPITFGIKPASAGNFRLIGGTIGATDPNTLFTLPAPPSTARYSLSASVDPGYVDLAVISIASSTWTSTASGTWENSANWQGNIIPGSPGNIATFSDSAVTGPIIATLTANETVGGLVFNANGGPTTIAANSPFKLTLDNTVNVGAGVAVDASAAGSDVNISAPLVLNDKVTVSVNTGRNLTISGAVTNGTGGNHTITVNAAGTVWLTASNTYSGNTTVSAGTLLVTNGSGSATGTGNVVVNSPGRLGGTGIISGTVTVNTGATIFAGTTNNTNGKVASLLTIGTGSSLLGSTLLDLTAAPNTPPALESSDEITVGAGLLTLGGTLTVTNPNNITFAAGQSYDLFGFGSETGTFSNTFPAGLPTLTGGLTWDTSALYTSGIISIGGGGATNGSASWTNTAMDNTWETTGNWTGGLVPGVAGNVATFSDSSVTGPVNPNLTSNETVGGLIFNGNGGATTISASAGKSLTLDNGVSGDATIGVTGGNVTISAPLTLNTNTDATINGSNTLGVSGNINGTGKLTTAGTGTVILSGSNSYGGGTHVSAGTLALESTTALPTASALTIDPSATVVVDRNGGGRITLDLASLTNSGTINLKDNRLVIHSANASTEATVFNQLQAGFAGGGWNGPSGILSSVAAGSSLYTLGEVLNGTDLNVNYAYFGDANLDGSVDGTDYSLIDSGFGGGGTGWQFGDFNYDGSIDGSDYSLIDNAFNTQSGSAPANQIAANTSEIASTSGSAAVPEPASLGLLGLGAIALLSRRRRRERNKSGQPA